MASLTVDTPDGKTLSVDVPEGTDPSKYGALADDAVSHYSSLNPPSESGPMSLFRGIANQMPLGQQFASLVSPGGYSQNMAAQNATADADKAAHPVAYGAGAATGAIAPALIPGVGETMAANPMTTGALLGGTGAIADTDLKKHPIQGAIQAAGGAGAGALLSGLISKILPSAQTLESKSNTLANKSVNMPGGVLVNMTPEEQQAQGAALRSAGIVTKDKSQALEKAKDLLTDYGQKIKDVGTTTEGQKLVADSSQQYDAMNSLLGKAQEFEGSANKVSKAIGRDYKAGATDIANLPDNPSWSDIQSLKEKYGKFAFKENATQGAKDTYFALSNMLKSIASKAQGNPGLSNEYKEALAGYSSMSPVVDGLKDAVDSELRGGGAGMGVRGMVGLIKRLPGPVRAVVGPAAALAGHPYIGMAAALPEIMNPAIQSNAAGGLASAMPSIQSAISQMGINSATSPEAQIKVSDLIDQLKRKFGTPISNRK